MYNFTDVTRYARKDITYVNCVLSRNSSAFWETSKEGLILENLDVDASSILFGAELIKIKYDK